MLTKVAPFDRRSRLKHGVEVLFDAVQVLGVGGFEGHRGPAGTVLREDVRVTDDEDPGARCCGVDVGKDEADRFRQGGDGVRQRVVAAAVVIISAVSPDLCRAPRGESGTVLEDAGEAEIVTADLQADKLSSRTQGGQLGRVVGTGRNHPGWY